MRKPKTKTPAPPTAEEIAETLDEFDAEVTVYHDTYFAARKAGKNDLCWDIYAAFCQMKAHRREWQAQIEAAQAVTD